MRRPIHLAVWLFLAAFLFSTAFTPSFAAEKSRTFRFTYTATLKDLPQGAKHVRVWIPVATSDDYQTVVLKRVSSPVPLRTTVEHAYGNHLRYAEFQPQAKPVTFTLVYEVTRHEYSKGDYASLMKFDQVKDPMPDSVERYLHPDRLIPVGGKLQEIADQTTQGKAGAISKAYALYDYVFHRLRYDKSGTGWGRGDAVWACDARHGNCTDFHSLFIALARDEKIPARFEIGFPLPEKQHAGMIPGYHCWAEFWVEGPGWVPVDISEAWQNPAKHDYFFGTIDANRVKFTQGRDLDLYPRQAGPPVNFLVYPYVEVDGQPYTHVATQFAFSDIDRHAARPRSAKSSAAH